MDTLYDKISQFTAVMRCNLQNAERIFLINNILFVVNLPVLIASGMKFAVL